MSSLWQSSSESVIARVVIRATSPTSSDAYPWRLPSTAKRMGRASIATTLLSNFPLCDCAKLTSAARCAALAGSGSLKGSPSVALARTTAATLNPSRDTSPQVPFSMCQASTASWPVKLTSEFAKHGPVKTSAVRDSMYSPEMWPAGWAAQMPPGRAIKATARSNDPAAIFTFIWLPPPPTTKTIFTLPGITFNPSAGERLRCFTAGTPRAAFLRIREAAIRPQERLCLRAPERTAWHGGGLLRRRDNVLAVRGRNVVAFIKHLLLPQALADRAVPDQSCQAWHDQAPPFAAASNARLTATCASLTL